MVNVELLKERIGECREGNGKSLNLKNMGLTPEEVAQIVPRIQQEFPNLEILNLSGNNLTNLPESLGNLTNLRQLYLGNNSLTDLFLGIVNLTLLTDLDLSKNPLSLRGLLYINAINPKPNRLGLSKSYRQTLDLISGDSKANDSQGKFTNIAMKIAYTFPNTSVEEFNTLYPRFSADQIRGMLEFSGPLRELGIGFDSNGRLSSELAIDTPISELFYKMDRPKTIGEMSGLAALQLQKTTESEYLQGIADFDLDENQDEGKLVTGKSTEAYVAFANMIFDETILESDPQKESTKNNMKQGLAEPIAGVAAAILPEEKDSFLSAPIVDWNAMRQPQPVSMSGTALESGSSADKDSDKKPKAKRKGTEKYENANKRPKH